MRQSAYIVALLFAPFLVRSQVNNPSPTGFYQIYLKQPVKEIKELLYDKDCTPINGTLGESKKTVIMEGYQTGNKVYIKVVYEDGSEEDFTRSPCFIDPVI